MTEKVRGTIRSMTREIEHKWNTYRFGIQLADETWYNIVRDIAVDVKSLIAGIKKGDEVIIEYEESSKGKRYIHSIFLPEAQVEKTVKAITSTAFTTEAIWDETLKFMASKFKFTEKELLETCIKSHGVARMFNCILMQKANNYKNKK